MDMLPSDSDWESSSDSGSSVGTDELGFLYGGHACSILSSLEESLGKIDDFLSFERGFLHGDIVCPVSDPSGQMGRVVNVNKFVNLENIWGKIVKNVDSKMLSKIQSISGGDYVVHGPWIGKVDKVVDSLAILFDDGTKCDVDAVDQEKVLPISPNLLDDSAYPYYPGQRVQVKLSSVSKTTRWLCGSSKENLDVGTVCSVKAGLVYIDWFACVLGGCDLSLPVPSRLQNGKDLTLLSCYAHENWQIGDWCILPMADCKDVTEQMIFDAPNLECIKEKTMTEAFKKQGSKSNCEDIFAIVKTKTIVDVMWQDGSCSIGIDSESLVPVNIVNGHEFWPGQFVLERGTCDPGNQKWGVVNGMDAKERTVKVTWKVNPENDVTSAQMEEIASAYELVEHPEFSYCYGDLVIKNVDETDNHQLNRSPGMSEDACEGTHFSQAQTEFSKAFLSSIGCVTDLKDGAVEVTWASGLKTKVQPNEIFRVDKYEGSTASSPLHEQSSEGLNQEMLDYEKQLSNLDRKDLPNSNHTAKEGKKFPWESASFLLPQSTVGFFKSIAANIFGSAGSTSLSGHVSANGHQSETHEEKGILKNCDICMEMQPLVADKGQKFEETASPQDVSIVQENLELQPSYTSKSTEQFGQFDMVGDCSDHHFLDSAGNGIALSQVKKGWLKKVQQEWSILEKDLPDSIYVRVYEERMDLIRAAIVGSHGTPYHDALFFFDLYLPPEYPHEPPLVFYRSGGFRVNPNLYESGRVCLSLLNTWAGTGTEVWSQNSSVLQVLLSLQALVLNEKPYFNEAGYDKQMGKAEGEKNSISYNEEAFLMTWKSMLCLLRQPPKHFETLVEEHLRKRSQCILSACKAYMEGAPVACPLGHEQTEQVNQKGSSTGFQIMLSKLFPKLVEAFSSKGVDCSQFT